ncbi:MAG: recombinase family protein, partial [Planctomycetota bacterium]
SQEEGLDQAFNSLDAQREAGLDYIRSQKHEGWQAIETAYDDGGFTGGNMERPGLKQLLKDIDYGLVDVVVVYKVDRLSRSLSDFAAMMKVFEDRNVSFVSVTQQFNTTTSMGRLTLNMLLSFAQFEREVAGERIRDKIAATKKQGYWVCGQPPLGYRLQREDEPRGLYIVEKEAKIVRAVFERFAECGSMLKTAQSLAAEDVTTKKWTSSTGRTHGGKPVTRKYLHTLVTSPVYIGKITHTPKAGGPTEVYDGQHEPIVPMALWTKAQSLIGSQDRDTQHRWSHPHLLKGKLRTSTGEAMSPSSTQRPLTKRGETRQKRLVPYYVSQRAIAHGFDACPLKSVNAQHLDDLVRAVMLDHIAIDALNTQPPEVRDHWIRETIGGVVLAPESMTIHLSNDAINRVSRHEFGALPNDVPNRPTCHRVPNVNEEAGIRVLTLPIQIKKHDGRRVILDPEGRDLVFPDRPEPTLHIVDAIGLAYRWHDELLKSGESIRQFASRTGIARTRIMRLLPLTQLGPESLGHALRGTLPPSVTLEDLLRAADDLDWSRQTQSLGVERRAAG